MSLTFILLGLFRQYVLYLNMKRDRFKTVNRDEAARTAFMDITDRVNENFRYEG